MNDTDAQRIAALLEEIRDDQRVQLQRQAEALAVQREQAAMARKQFERAEKLNDRAVTICELRAWIASSQIVTAARGLMMIALPVVAVLLVYVSWLVFRR